LEVLYDVVVKSSRSLSHLLMSSCKAYVVKPSRSQQHFIKSNE